MTMLTLSILGIRSLESMGIDLTVDERDSYCRRDAGGSHSAHSPRRIPGADPGAPDVHAREIAAGHLARFFDPQSEPLPPDPPIIP